MDNGKNISIATGTLLSDRLVLTAAHSFFDRNMHTKKVSPCVPKYFRFQLHGNFKESDTYEVEEFRLNSIFANMMQVCQGEERYNDLKKELHKDLIGFDYALIKLNRPISAASFPKMLCNYSIG